jgi:hypothetical protein
MEKLAETPLLVLDNVDRAIRSWPRTATYSFESSCSSQDLIRLARLLQERNAGLRPTVMTSRAEPAECPARLAAITRTDLVRGLVGTAVGASDPFEDFPAYTEGVLRGAMEETRRNANIHLLDIPQELAAAA